MAKKKIAFVLGGGSIKGAYQIGQMHTLIHKNIYPNIITGISVGSLNALLYAHFLGKHINPMHAVNSCIDFWIDKVKSPDSIIKQKNIARIVYEIISSKFNGLLYMDKLDNMVKSETSLSNVEKANLELSVGAVNINSGRIKYVSKRNPKFKSYVLASTRIPLMMPILTTDGNDYLDGGLIDNAAIGQAIDMGADTIHVLATHPERVTIGFNEGHNLLDLVDRIMEITVNNTLNNDIKLAELYNYEVQNNFGNKKYIELYIHRPEKALKIAINGFDSTDIKNMIELGKRSI